MIQVDMPSVRCPSFICHAQGFNQLLAAAESRIAAALACHTRSDYLRNINGPCCDCLYEWDTVNDRCTSPTVTALLGEDS